MSDICSKLSSGFKGNLNFSPLKYGLSLLPSTHFTSLSPPEFSILGLLASLLDTQSLAITFKAFALCLFYRTCLPQPRSVHAWLLFWGRRIWLKSLVSSEMLSLNNQKSADLTSVLPNQNVFGFASPFLPSLNCKFRESKNCMSASPVSPQSLGQLEDRRNSIRLKPS